VILGRVLLTQKERGRLSKPMRKWNCTSITSKNKTEGREEEEGGYKVQQHSPSEGGCLAKKEVLALSLSQIQTGPRRRDSGSGQEVVFHC